MLLFSSVAEYALRGLDAQPFCPFADFWLDRHSYN